MGPSRYHAPKPAPSGVPSLLLQAHVEVHTGATGLAPQDCPVLEFEMYEVAPSGRPVLDMHNPLNHAHRHRQWPTLPVYSIRLPPPLGLLEGRDRKAMDDLFLPTPAARGSDHPISLPPSDEIFLRPFGDCGRRT